MRKLVLLALLMTTVIGCKNVSNPFTRRDSDRAGNDILTNPDLDEQQKRARSRYSYVEDDRNIAPPGFIGRPTPGGR